ncbi:MAG: MBL fold metallo-hydrolase [Acidimicrobiia bacterium]|nr:MBL fold metallo-hydrolase [Acidimicrobiia bacterium]
MPDTFTLHEAAPGVHAAVSRHFGGPAVSNAAIVDLGDKTLVVDTFMTMVAADELAEAAANLTGRRAFLVVTSHFHGDHVGGNPSFADVPIVATRRTMELQRARSAADAAAYGAEVDAALHAARLAVEQAEDEESEAAARLRLSMAQAMDRTRHRYALTLPDLLIEDRLVVEGSDRSVEILATGRGHTESDVVVHVPDASTVVAGDLVWNGVHPKTDDGFPGEWASVVASLRERGVTTVVPGHGDVTDASSLDAMEHYLRDVAGLVEAVRAGDAEPDEVDAPEGFEDWTGIDRLRTGVRIVAGRGSD